MMTQVMKEVLKRGNDTGSLYKKNVHQFYGQSTTSLAIDRLVAEGYLRKKPMGYIEITDKGYEALGMRRPES
jgi:hypothetical protein